MAVRYIAVVGINWPDKGQPKGRRAEPGQEVPAAVIKANGWLLEQHLVEVVAVEKEAANEAGEVV